MPTPVVEKVEQMTFGTAMDEVAKGAKVARLEWEGSAYLYLDRWLLINKDGKDHTLRVTDGDMLGTDWVIILD
jgi:hypothetical protein